PRRRRRPPSTPLAESARRRRHRLRGGDRALASWRPSTVRSDQCGKRSRRTRRPRGRRHEMAKLIYSAITSLDGYIEDAEGKFEWAEPDEEVHAFVNDLERPVGTYLYGRRMYETMVFWERPPELTAQPPFVQDFAGIWQGADKIVYSRTLLTVTSAKTLIEREFDPEAIRQLKAKAGADLSI